MHACTNLFGAGYVSYEKFDLTPQASSVGGKKHSVNTDYILKVLGLDVCAETIVGSDMIRGVSGGQRKRVTTGLSLPFFRN